ncbi:transporter [Moraxella caviae]|uniref:Outer membrane protein oprM n=1 Tax=Moraxella caviae TaxID=34060 RepID=A0A1T0A923_9GAMM|nr:efflux transporter outer membrane subunit [Moraxella caviae]OOR92224.1 transporter [Moraxella caviae]STZ14860.1 Outer membrane protein oprM precursor [Moraxella caviae]
MKKSVLAVRVFAVSALALSMAACSSLPKKAQTPIAMPNIDMDSQFEILDKDTVSTAEAPSVAVVRWQDFYTDPKLQALIELGLKNNKDLQSAVLAVQRARAQYQITDANTLPSVGVGGGATRSQTPADRNSSSGYNVNLAMSSYELDLWGKVASAKQAALYDYLGTNAARDAVQISLISSIAQGYVNLSYAMAQRQLALETLKTREHSLAITQKRYQAGIDARSSSLQAEASLESAKLSVYNADTSILQYRNALQLLLGAPIPTELVPDLAVDNITSQTLFSTGLPSELLYYRPDIVQAEYALKSAGANINVARAAYFPSISLAGNLGYSSSSLSNLLQSSAFGWSFGPSVNLPIFDAGLRRANYEVAQVAQQSALTAYEKAIQTAFKEVGDVLATRATLNQQLESQYKLQDNFQQTYRIAHARFRAGLDDYLNVLDAERSLFANQQSILALEQQKVVSQIQLYQTLGGGASLSAEQITEFNRQREAMRTAALTQVSADAAANATNTTESGVQITQPAPSETQP